MSVYRCQVNYECDLGFVIQGNYKRKFRVSCQLLFFFVIVIYRTMVGISAGRANLAIEINPLISCFGFEVHFPCHKLALLFIN